MKKTNRSAVHLVMASVLAALSCAATLVLTIPSPTGGYMNLGDTVVILGAYLLGPWWGGAAGAIAPTYQPSCEMVVIRVLAQQG